MTESIGLDDREQRPAKLTKLLRRADAGDVFMMTRLDRLAPSTRDLLNILDTISKAGAGFKSLLIPGPMRTSGVRPLSGARRARRWWTSRAPLASRTQRSAVCEAQLKFGTRANGKEASLLA